MLNIKKYRLGIGLTIFLLLLLILIDLFWASPILPFDQVNHFLFNGLVAKIQHVRAGSDANVRGWLYSENLDWFNTNCYNDYDNDGLFNCCCNGGPGGSYCPSDAQTCPYGVAAGDYGIHADIDSVQATNVVSGFAWAEKYADWSNVTTVADATRGYIAFGTSAGGTAPDNYSAWACVGKRHSGGTCVGDCEEDFNYQNSCSGDPDLVGHWKFNSVDATGLTQSEVGGTGLQAQLGPTYHSDSPYQVTGLVKTGSSSNTALNYDIDDNPSSANHVWAKVTNPSGLPVAPGTPGGGSPFTLEGWIFLKGNHSENQVMLYRENAYMLGYIPSTYNAFQAKVKNGETWLTLDFADTDFASNYLNKWRHVAMVYAGDGLYKLYLDGVLDSVYRTSAIQITPAAGNLYFGGDEVAQGGGAGAGDTESISAWWNGYIDNIAIYNRAKTSEEIWQDAKKEVYGWAKIKTGDNEAWLKLNGSTSQTYDAIDPDTHQANGVTRDAQYWGMFLTDHNDGGGFYTLSGERYEDAPPYDYQLRTWAWSSDYSLGWLTGTHPFSQRAPDLFNTFFAAPTSPINGNPAVAMSWEEARHAERYEFYRCPAQLLANGTYECTDDYLPYSVPAGSCSGGTCSTNDTWWLEPNSYYCYKMLAWNRRDSTWASSSLPDHPQPFCLKTNIESPEDNTIIQGQTCGQLQVLWNPTTEEETNVDGYNLYRSVKDDGCTTLSGSQCLMVAHLGESIKTDNLIGHWKMNESTWDNQVADDSSPYQNDATAIGTAYPTATGSKFNRSGSFNGGRLNVSDRTILDIDLSTNSLTISAWVKTSADGVVLEKRTGAIGYDMTISSGRLQCYVGDVDQETAITTGTTILTDNQWHYLACVATSQGTLKAFVDNKWEGTPASLTAIDTLANNADLHIAGTPTFAGLLDNVNLAKRAKDHSELLFESESQDLATACSLVDDQIIPYDSAGIKVCDSLGQGEGSCCQIIDKKVNPKQTYYYWLTQTTGAGESSANAPDTGCNNPNSSSYRYGCDKTICEPRVKIRE